MLKKSKIACLILSLFILAVPIITTSTSIHAAEKSTSLQMERNQVVSILKNNGYLEIDNQAKTVKITQKYKEAVYEKLDSNHVAIFTENSVSIIPKDPLRAFSGVNKVVYTWKGYDLYLNSTNANKAAAGIGIAGVLAAFIPDPIVSKALAAALGIASGLIAYNNAAGRGVIIAYIGLPTSSSLPHWITSQ
ncbi:TPA: ABC transporter ATP-binding protein [Enterococcus faecium]